jgi:hypothetical protein
MKGDSITVKFQVGDSFASEAMVAETNGSSVEWSEDRKWVTVTQLSKAQKVTRTMKFKADTVVAIVEDPARPV